MKLKSYIAFLFVLTFFISGCYSTWRTTKTEYDTKFKKEGDGNKYYMEASYSKGLNAINIQLEKDVVEVEKKRKTLHKEKQLTGWEENPWSSIGAGFIFGIGTAAATSVGAGIVVGLITIPIGAAIKTKEKKHETQEGDWYNTGNKRTIKENASNETIAISLETDNNYTRYLNYPSIISTDYSGEATAKIKNNEDFLISQKNRFWNDIPDESELIFATFKVKHRKSGLEETIKAGTYKILGDYYYNQIITKLRLNVLDVNSRFPLENTRIRCQLPPENVLEGIVKDKLPNAENSIQEYVVDRLIDKWEYYFVTDFNGSVEIPLIKGLDYAFNTIDKRA
jgi:hypothetical protein